MDHNRLITQPVISDNATGYHEMKTMKMVEDDDAFLFLATWTQQIKRFTAGSMENRRRPKGQPDGRRPKGQPTWVQAWTQTLYELGNGSLRGCVAAVVGECVNQRRRNHRRSTWSVFAILTAKRMLSTLI